MDKKTAINGGKKAVYVFFKIRRWFKIYLAFATGILSGIYICRIVYDATENRLRSVLMAVLCAAMITAVMIIIIELMHRSVSKLKKLGLKIIKKDKMENGGE